jgi:outer membrane protein, heavy metal efflux system
MTRMECVLFFVVACVAGCASPSQSDPQFVANEQHIHQVVAHEVNHVPDLIQTNAEIEGEHPLGYYVQIALGQNPEILAAHRAINASAAVIPQVIALDDPMLVDTLQPFDKHSVQTAAGRAPNTLTLSQKFPWFGKLDARGQVAEQEVQIVMTRLAQAELKVTEDVRLSYYEMQFSQRAIAITEEDAALLGDLLKIAEARYRTGGASQQDVLRAQVELNKIDDRLITLRRQLRQSQADLARVLHVSPESNLLATSDVEIPSAPEQIEQLYQMAAECRPELQERFYSMQKSQRARDVAELNYYPDITAGLGWQTVTANDSLSRVANGNDNLMMTVGVNLPIWRDKLDAGVREWEQRSLENARRYEATLDDTFRMVRRLMVQIDAIQQQLDLFKGSMIPKTEQALRVSTADYRVNKVDFQQLLDNWSDMLMFHVQVARLEASLAQTLASLERVVGCELASAPSSVPMPEPAARAIAPAAGIPLLTPVPATPPR